MKRLPAEVMAMFGGATLVSP
eukprot:COSAG03_NODE_23980_length_275_cov_1.488636_1_plen_20_part_01